MSSSPPSLAPPSPQLLPSPLPLSPMPPSPPEPPGPSVSVRGTPDATRHTTGLVVVTIAAGWRPVVRSDRLSGLEGAEKRKVLSLAHRLHRVGSLQIAACMQACGGRCVGQGKVMAVRRGGEWVNSHA